LKIVNVRNENIVDKEYIMCSEELPSHVSGKKTLEKI